MNQAKTDWLQQRKRGIGGSDASVILGINPWKTQFELWLEKRGELQINEEKTEEHLYWGNVLEDVIAKEFSKRTGLKVRRKNSIIYSKEHPFMLANVDRLIVGEPVGLECKTANAYMTKHWEQGVPPYYIAQVQHYMAVLGYKCWYVAVLIGGQKFQYYKIDRDEEYIKSLIKAEQDFWHKVINNIQPEVDGSKACTEFLNKLYPEAIEEEKQLGDEVLDWIRLLDKVTEEERAISERKAEIQNKIKQALGEAQRGIAGDRTIIWQNIVSNRLDSKALKKDLPDIFEKYSKPSSYRRFEVK